MTVLVGEAFGEQEKLYRHPFVGTSGQELMRMLAQASWPVENLPYKFINSASMIPKWQASGLTLLNVFNSQPADNNVELFYAHPSDQIPIDKSLPSRRINNSIYYVRADAAADVHLLRERLLGLRPNLIIALGNTATWALGLGGSISKIRGIIHQTPYGKVLPTYHPSSVLRQWSNRTITLLDLYKAKRESVYPEIRLTPRYIWTEPSIENLWQWWEDHGSKSKLLAIDIETSRQISEVGFASDSTHALHIPFFYKDRKSGKFVNYWSSLQEEIDAWKFIKHVCESEIPKIGQNLKYDAYWLAKEMKIAIRNWQEDTMQKAHCWQPELEKSLGFLGSIFLDERSWKQLRKHSDKDEVEDK